MAISKDSAKNLREIFVDEFIIIYLKDMNVVTTDAEGQEFKISAMIEAYVIDIDMNFYYCGLPDGTVTKTVPHESIGLVEISMPMEQMISPDYPTPDEDVH